MTKIITHKRCNKCGEFKAASEYRKAKYGHPHQPCKVCFNVLARTRANTDEGRAKNKARSKPLSVEAKDRARAVTRLREFGITEDDYQTMLIQQGGLCAICGGSNGERRLAVDHDHKTGKVRGLICGHCNLGIGLLQDDTSILEKAITYLKRFMV